MADLDRPIIGPVTTTPRRRYAKGVARREEILQAALNAYSLSDRNGPRLRDIADAVGLTEAGVLHYFASKDDLFVAILQARDEEAAKRFDLTSLNGILDYLTETTRTPGLTKLFVDMSAAAADPEHPATAFMARHDLAARRMLGTAAGIDDPVLGRIAVAAAEGLQMRWLRDPSVDLVADLRRLVKELRAIEERA